MFSQACVKNSVHRGGVLAGGVHGRGCLWQGTYIGGVCGGGHACLGACVAGSVCVAWGGMCGGVHAWHRGVWWGHAWHTRTPSRYYEMRSMSRRYASYWNAFLFETSKAKWVDPDCEIGTRVDTHCKFLNRVQIFTAHTSIILSCHEAVKVSR